MTRRIITRLRRDERGFTLVEQLIVCAGLVVILGAILGLLEVSQKLAPQDNERAHAVQEARAGLDRMTRELRHAQDGVVVGNLSVTANVAVRGQTYSVTYDCSGFVPGSTTQRRCTRTKGGSTEMVLDRVINPTTRPVFTQTLRSGIPSFVAIRVEVPASGTRIKGQAHRIVLENGAYLRNADVLSRLRDESGFTLIELMVAMVICAIGIMSTVVVLDRTRTLGDQAEAREVLAHHAQLELERALALDWSVLGHPTTPARSTTAGHPASYVTTNSPARYQFDRSDSTRSEELKVIATTGAVAAAGTQWTDSSNTSGNRLTGWVYRYVTRNAADTVRRITVVATVNAPSTNPPVLVSSLVTNP